MNAGGILINAFSASTEMVTSYLSFILLIWGIIFIDLHMLNHPCSPIVNPTFSLNVWLI